MSSSSSSQGENSTQEIQVPLAHVAAFVRQLSHDLRNHLNAAELQSSYLGELSEDAEMKDEVKRLRGMLAEMNASLQRVTQALAAVKLTLMPYEAVNFVEDLRRKLAMEFPAETDAIEWKMGGGKADLNIDPQILQPAFLEIFANAFQHERGPGVLRATAEMNGSEFTFTLTEPKTTFSEETETWGRRPFSKMKHGHYGLGLPRVLDIIEAHQGRLHAHYDSGASSLVTTVVLPLGPVG
ncbi:MAG: hypothetical protein ABI946_08425 [Chthoniobacterales bacterium]